MAFRSKFFTESMTVVRVGPRVGSPLGVMCWRCKGTEWEEDEKWLYETLRCNKCGWHRRPVGAEWSETQGD